MIPGTKIGPYEIRSTLGEGGMGVVFRALDTKLHREVALKFLPEQFAQDPERLSRFEREAHLLASLNHPNIAQIYGLEDSTSSQCIAMELVEGETLAERLQAGPMPVPEALKVAKQVAEALEAAHEKGIIHRDLKPANIKIRPDGAVKVLDFGLAKALEQIDARTDLSNSPTMLRAGPTQPNIILGTAAYMAPEQARGRTSDARSDIFAFGCVLYEMLTGEQAFSGETITDILARIVTTDPDWTKLPANTQPEIRSLVRRCLQKDRNNRLHHVADARIEIESTLNQPAHERGAEIALTPTRKNFSRLPWGIAAVSVALLIAVVLFSFRSPAVNPAELRLDVTTPPTSDAISIAISPDGRHIAFVAFGEGKSLLFIRDLDSTTARPVPTTDAAAYPFWSPDGRSIGFFADGKLKRIDISGGTSQVLASAPTPRGGSWSPNGTIIFAPTVGALYQVPASGGDAALVTKIEAPLSSHRFPKFLPDGEHFLFFGQGNTSVNGVYVSDLKGMPPRWLLASDSTAVYEAGDYLAFTRQGTLFAQKFNLKTLDLAGDPIRVANDVLSDGVVWVSALAASGNGAIAYRGGGVGVGSRLVWLDRAGHEVSAGGNPDSSLNSPELSPDERHVALYWTTDGNVDIWIVETTRNVSARFTSDPSNDNFPVWSPDGKWIAFGSTRNGPYNIFRKLASGVGPEEMLLQSPQNQLPSDWSADGRFILFRLTDQKNGYDLWALPTFGDRKSIPVATTLFEERDGQFSPDSRWVAYSSNESGRSEIYAQPFPEPGGKVQISTNGGTQPRWRHDGKEMFYLAPGNSLMSVPIKVSTGGDSLEPGPPVTLFRTRIVSNAVAGGRQEYAVARDGQRFLAVAASGDTAASPITILLNWKPPRN
jgi:eukaryotic-like serine/threonine-protein kinase